MAALALPTWAATSSSSVSGRSSGVSPGQHEDGRVVVEVVAGEGRQPDGGGVAGAALRRLLDERDVGPRRRLLLDLLGHPFGAVADDDRRALRAHQLEGVDHVQDHRPAADHVQRLGPGGAHPRALAGGQHDRDSHWRSPATQAVAGRSLAGARSLAPEVNLFIAPGRGIEPLFTEPKSGVLPIERPRIVPRGHIGHGIARVPDRPVACPPVWVR